MPLTRDEALSMLGHARSPQRRRGAKRLRDLADPSTADAVRSALIAEARDQRTWQTQYELVLALGATGSGDDLPLLKDLALQPRDASMVNCALGYAIVKLGWVHQQDTEWIRWCHEQVLVPHTEGLRHQFEERGEDAWLPLLDEGARAAVLDVRITPPPEVITLMIEGASTRLDDPERQQDTIGIYVVMAAAIWDGEQVRAFLDRYANDHRPDIAAAARRSLQGLTSRSDVYNL